MKPAAALLLVGILLATAALAVAIQSPHDPLAPFRAADGSLHIPGRALTPEIQRLLFGPNDLQPFWNLTYFAPAPSPYPTMQLVQRGYLEPNLNVFAHPNKEPESLAAGVAHLISQWFPPMDWGAALRSATGWFFGLFTWDARAAVVVDSTTVTDVGAPANTCSTAQTAAASDNAILVMLSERGTFTLLSATYGSASLTLVASTDANGGTFVRTEIWGFAGIVPAGPQTMTATLSGGQAARMSCATILLQGVKSTASFINGTSNTNTTANASITLTSAVTTGNLGIAVTAIQQGGGGIPPTAVTGTGATATDLYGVATQHCTGGGGANECAAGASIPNPGTAITWTNAATTWVVSAVEVVAIPTCGTVGGANCYRIGAGGTWTSAANWSNTPGGASCGCTPTTTDTAIFNASPTGTTTLSAATTIAAIDMTGFTGTLDTSNANNWSLTVNGNFAIQGTFLPRASTITIAGNVTVLGAATVVTMSTSAWTINGTWTNNSTSAAWSAGTGTVTIRDAVGGTLTFANLAGAANEFNNLTLDASIAAGLTYTMATSGLRIAGTLTLRNSTAGATGATILDTSPANLAVTAGALTVTTLGAFNTEGSTVTANGTVNISAANAYVRNTGGSWVVTGAWTDASTSASWSFAAAISFRSTISRTMTFGAQAGNEFAGPVTFDTTVTTAVTYTMATNPLDAAGTLTIQNSAGGATGAVTLDTSAGSLAVTAGGLTQSTLGAFNTRTSPITLNGDVSIGAATAYITNTGGSWSVSGAWTNRTTSASWSFGAAMTFRAAASKTTTFTGSNIAGNEFAGSVTFDTSSATGITFTLAAGATGDASLKIGGALTIRNTAGGATAATILDTSAGNYNVTAGSFTLGAPRGVLRSEGSTITINGAVNVSDASSYLVLGTATWIVTGSWTNNSTNLVDWSAGTGTITFRDAANATMTFANLGGSELNNVIFDTPTAAGITYTMAANGLRMAATLTVQNTAATPTGNVVLTTSASNLSITAGSIVIGTRGTLTANASTITVNGSWTSTAANHLWNKGTSTVVFAASGTLTMSAGESFNLFTVSAGTTTLGSNITTSGATTVNGTLDTSASNFTLTLQSTLSIGASGVLNLEASTASTTGNVTIAAGGAVRFAGAGTWTISGSWTDNNTMVPANWAVAASTVRIVDAAAATLTFWTAPGNEFNNLILDASVAAGFAYTQVNALQAAGTLTIQNTAGGASGAVTLDASASNYNSTVGGLSLGGLGGYTSRSATVTVGGNVAVAANGSITSAAGGTWVVTGSWTNNTTSAAWAFSSPITFRSAASQTMTFKAAATEFGSAVTFDTTAAAGVTYTMAANALTLTGFLTVRNSVASPTGNTILDTSGSDLGITAGSVTLGTNGTLRARGATISVGGNWTGTAANATFTPGTSTVVFTSAATINMTQAFNNLTITAGTSTLAANTTVNAALTVSGGALAKGIFTLSTASLTLSGGSLTSTSGTGTISGNVTVSSPSSFISLGSGTWTIGGTWTNASTSASWSAGTGTVVFNDASAATMTFAGANLAGIEFNNLTFDTTAAAGVAYTMAANGLRIGGSLLLQNSVGSPTGNTVLGTSNLPVTSGTVTIGTSGTLSAGSSTLSVGGNWTVTAANATFGAGTSTVSFGANATVNMTQAFYNLTVTSGTVAAGSAITAVNALTVSGGTFAKSTATLSVGTLTLSGGALTSTSGNAAISGNVTMSAAASYIAFGSETWSVSGSWDNGSTSASWNAGTATLIFNASSAQTMTFAGSNLAGSEFANVTFNSGSSAVAFTLATRGLRVAGTLTIGGGTGTTTLDTSGSNVPVNAVTLDVVAGGALTANGSTITITSIDTHLGGLTAGTSTFIVNASGGTVNVPQGVNNLTVNPAISTTFTGSLTWSGTFTLTGATVAFGASSLTSNGPATMTFASAVITMSTGSWDTSSVTTFTATSSSVSFSGTGTLAIGATASFAAFTLIGGTRTLLSQLAASGLLSVSGGTLAKGSNPLLANGGLTLAGGALTSTSGAVTITGDVTISAAASYVAFGSEAWIVTGSWTNASTSASWTTGTATVTFTSASSQAMRFAALPAGAPEFYNAVFDGGASTVTFTMAANPLVWSGTLAVHGGTGTTTFATSDLALTGGSVSIGNAGNLAANASTVTVSNVSMTGGTSGGLTLTSGQWTVNGNWDTTGSGSAMSVGTSTFTFAGTSTTMNLAPGQMFYDVAINGTVTISSSLTASASLTVNDGAVLTKTGRSVTFNTLTVTGTGRIVDGAVTVRNVTMANSDVPNLTTISVFTIWILGSEFNWAHSSTVGTSTLTFTIGGNTSGDRFNVTKDGAAFTTGLVDASGQIVFTMLGSDPVVDVIIAAPCGGNRYWVGGTGAWSDTGHWSSVSGGPGGCQVPNPSMAVFFDAASGGGAVTLDQAAAIATLNTTGWSGIIGLGTFDLAVGGDITHGGGTIRIGASAGTGLTATGNLALSGSAILDGIGVASSVSINGNTTISSATAYFRMGTGTWTFGGSWSNASASASWAPGTGTVVFNSTASRGMTFAGFAGSEFYNVTFESTAGAGAVIFTMGTNPLKWIHTLTIQDSSGSTTTLVTANLSLTGGSLIVGNAGILTASASAVAVVDVSMNAGTSGTITLTTGIWTVSGTWDTSGTGSTFARGTSTVTMSGPSATVRILGPTAGFHNLIVSGTVSAATALDVSGALSVTGTLTTSGNAITGGADLMISGGGSLIGTTSSLVVASVTMNDASANTLSLTTGSMSVSGSWDTSGASSTFNAGASTVTFTGASATITLGASQAFATLVLAGSCTLVSQLTSASLTLSGGVLVKGAHPVTLSGNLTLAGGSLTSISGSVTIGGNVDVSSASSYLAFGSEAWTISGSWTNTSTSGSWSAGTGIVTFNSSSDQTMAFAGTHLSSPEFDAVVFNSGSSSVTFTMAVSGLLARTITIQGGPGTTTLNTSGANLAVTAATVTVSAGGVLVANGSTITVQSMDTSAGELTAGTSTVVVNASGGSINIPQPLGSLTVNPGIGTTFVSNLTWSGVLIWTGATVALSGDLLSAGPASLSISTATILIEGSWTTASVASLISSGSTVTFTGAGQTITLGPGQRFGALTIAGAIALASDLVASSLTVSASGILTKTGYSFSFNSLTLNGTIADGTANVTNLAVTNSNASALVTISAFSAWNVGSAYAWTHTSSETSQTITWTIGGNTAGHLFTVAKNGSSFTTGTVDASGQIIFTMLGSDPNVRVTVVPPPVPAWWQSPYFLAIPPIGFLMVVAMFVQRRRWRPAKAFLVDERGQLLREFTLDPSCQVSYDQAVQAGALDAVDKDVRVSKYHARAVRGDVLSLIMLAVGPANIEEVEFARGLLVNIQDKFEDRVIQRVEEARAEETNLESARAKADEERVDLQARARVFGDMVNAFTIARTKLDVDSLKLRKQDTNLRERETRVAADRAGLDERSAQLEDRQGSLDRAAADVEARHKELTETTQNLEAREARLSPKEQELAERSEALSKAESDFAERNETIVAAEAKLTGDLEDYHIKAQQLAKLDGELSEERKSLDDLSVQIDEEEENLKAKTASVEAREAENATTAESLKAKLAEIEPREQGIATRESEVASRETTLTQKEDVLAAREKEITAQQSDLRAREAALADRTQELADERKALDALTKEAVEERKALDVKASGLAEQEADVAEKTRGLADLKENLGPREAALFQKETDLATREKALAEERTAFQSQQDLVAAKALEIEQQMESIKERESALDQEKTILQEARGAFETATKELETQKAAYAREVEQREADLAAQERTLGEARMRLSKDGETFEVQRAEKSQWIASKEIELEAKEQTLADREGEIRAQAEANAGQLADLAAREETVEIEGDKLDKARAEAETRKAELGAISRDLEAKSARFRDEEARRGEELRTWQATLESEQALLKEQKETFEKEMQDLRESWAGRMIRVEQREEELQERETKVQADVEWVARNESELVKREKLATDNLRSANELKAEGERVRGDLEQRALEIESRERSVREEAANQSVELEKRSETLQTLEAELAGRKAQSERELATQTQRLKDREAELMERKGSLDTHEADLVAREAVLTNGQAALRQDEDRLARDKIDLQAMQKQLESKELELGQTRERLDAESLRLRTETDAVRQSLASKEADLLSERERLERESSALQEKLGTKAKEMAAREKSLVAREEDLRTQEQDLEARLREIESRERQAEARAAEITAREQALSHGEQEQTARRAEFDETVQKFEAEAVARQQEWKDLQATLKSQEAQLAASTETRQAEIRKRMEELEQRERSANATLTQAQIERTRVEAQAKEQGAKQAEIEAATGRADKRFAELKAMEDELLKSRQGFESEKAGWSARRNEELKQLEATRDAAGEQTQQAERLIEDSQRRAYVAAEAEKAAKRQAEELTAAQATLDRKRADAEKAEKDLEGQMAQLREASQRLAATEIDLGSRAKDLDALRARLNDMEKKGLETAENLKGRKTALDQEAERIATLAAQLDKRQAEDETRHAAVETKLADVTKREQILSTELQRADNLMEDLNRKEAELVTRDKGFASHQEELAKRELALSQRDSELRDGMQTLERLRREHETRAAQAEQDHRAAAEARKDAEATRTEAEKLKTQADGMQAEVSKNMRFLQKKALDVLDREEKLRGREAKIDEQARLLESRAQILDQKDRALESEKDEQTTRLDKLKQDNEKLKAKLAEAEKASKSTVDMDEWRRDIDNRVKIIQKKALDLLDREEKLRKKEEELRALATQLGVETKS